MFESMDPGFIRLGIFLGIGVCFTIVVLHASFTNKNVIVWGVISLIPILGIILYFTMHFVQLAGDSTRRSKVQEERRWEFVLTDKGKKIDPNKKEEDETLKTYGDGVTKNVIAETPPSRIPEDENK